MRNALPKNGPRKNESAIVNLDDKDGPGTHWVAYKKNRNNVIYFDSFGNLRSPEDFVKYLGVNKIKYNHERFQDYDTFICGHLCLKFLNQKRKQLQLLELSITRTVMSESLILSLSGKSSELETTYFPSIELATEKNYVLGLVELLTFNSIPNIDSNNNKFHIVELRKVDDKAVVEIKELIEIPVGSYEIEDIENYLIGVLEPKGIKLSIKANNNTLKSVIECNKTIDFRYKDSIGSLLGFTPRLLHADTVHDSNQPVSILKVNSLRVECNITTGAYSNDQKVHTIHEFFPAVPPGYKIIEVPSQTCQYPLKISINHNYALLIKTKIW